MSRSSLHAFLIVMLVFLGLSEQASASPWRFWGGAGLGRAVNEYVPGGGVSSLAGSYEDEVPVVALAVHTGAVRRFGSNIGVGAEVGWIVGMRTSRQLSVPGAYCGYYSRDVTLSVVPVTAQLYYSPTGAGSMRPELAVGAGPYAVITSVRAREIELCEPVGDFGSSATVHLGGNVGISAVFLRPDGSRRFGLSARLHSVAVPEESLRLVTLIAQWYIN